MIIVIAGIFLLIISLFLAIVAVQAEFSVPDEVKKLKIKRKKKISGVILFLKKKIIHYSSSSS